MANAVRIGLVGILLALLLAGCATPTQTTYTSPKPPPAPTATANVRDISRVTHDRAPELWPRVSPDGTKLLFHTFDITKTDVRGWSIVLIQIGVPGRTLVAGPYANCPAWYPDGKYFVYPYLKLVKPILVRTSVGGVGMTFIRAQPLGAQDSQPDVSPDGKRIAFHTKIGDSRQVCFVDADGGNFTIYTEGSSPRWHPDGKKLAFDRRVGGKYHCFVLDLTSGQVTQLTGGDSRNALPVWSPDGTWLVFESDRDGRRHLYAMRADGSQVTQLTSGGSQETFPEWASNNLIYFTSDAGAPEAQSTKTSLWRYANIWRLKPALPE
jgi:TolB protein